MVSRVKVCRASLFHFFTKLGRSSIDAIKLITSFCNRQPNTHVISMQYFMFYHSSLLVLRHWANGQCPGSQLTLVTPLTLAGIKSKPTTPEAIVPLSRPFELLIIVIKQKHQKIKHLHNLYSMQNDFLG